MLKIEKSFEEISIETFLVTMFKYGFDKIDPALYVLTLEVVGEKGNYCFNFSQTKPLSKRFKSNIEYNGLFYKAKEGKNIEKYLNESYNENLLRALNEVNFEKVIEKKLSIYDIDGANIDSFHFSKKELEIRKEQVKRISEAFKEAEAKEEMAKLDRERMEYNDEYITWLVDFMSGREDFNPEIMYYKANEYSDYEKNQIKKLHLLIDVISDCLDDEEESYDKSVKVSHLDTVLLLQEFHGQGTEYYIKKITKEEEKKESVSYKDVLEFYKRKRAFIRTISRVYFESEESSKNTNKSSFIPTEEVIQEEVKKFTKKLNDPLYNKVIDSMGEDE